MFKLPALLISILSQLVGIIPVQPSTKPLFTQASFMPLATLKPALQGRWSWPSIGTFHQTWMDAEREVHPARLIRAFVRGVDVGEVVLVLVPQSEDRYEIEVIFSTGPDLGIYEIEEVLGSDPWSLQTGIAIGEIRFHQKTRTLIVDASYVSPEAAHHDNSFRDWVYSAALLSLGGSVYDESAVGHASLDDNQTDGKWRRVQRDMMKDPPHALSGIQQLLDSGARPSDDRWRQAAMFASRHDPKLAMRIYRAYRPVGGCSMDTTPAEVAQEYADLCYAQGNLGCFLQLSVQIMGNQFDRMSWGTYAEPVHSTHVT